MKSALRLLFTLAAHGLFWGWNLLFLLIIFLGLGPEVVLGLVIGTLNGFVPWHITAFALALMALPVAGMAVGGLLWRRDPGRLLSLFYGVQAPLILLCMLRLFGVGAMIPATALYLFALVVGCAGLLRTLITGPSARTPGGQALLHICQTIYLIFGLGWGASVALFFTPSAVLIGLSPILLFHPSTLRFIFQAPLEELLLLPFGLLFALPFFAFFALTLLTLLTLPVAALGISIRAWQLVHRATVARLGIPRTCLLTLTTFAGLALAYGLVSAQPQQAAFTLLHEVQTDADRRHALTQSEAIREGLLNARLSHVRYPFTRPAHADISSSWARLIGDDLAEAPNLALRALIHPLIYRPAAEEKVRSQPAPSWTRVGMPFARMPSSAELAYAAFFDAPMERTERDTLIRATRQTWSWREAQATLLDIGEQRVHLDSQQITVEPHGDLATVLIHDVYRSLVWEEEEVLLAFSLPEGAVPTGLWLGTSPDRDEAFRFVVAPRGAAQEVYEAQVQKRIDPALLEQVGPQQYRLRAFPITPRQGSPASVLSMGSKGAEFHLWMELVVGLMETEDGPVFPLPVLSETRNLFWDRQTRRSVNGEVVHAESWTPSAIAAQGVQRAAHSTQIGPYHVQATPAEAQLPEKKGRITVLIDDTRSMSAHREAVGDALRRLGDLAEQVEVLCVVEQVLQRCEGFSADRALFWGSTALERRLVEANPLALGSEALVVLTDEGSYDLASSSEIRFLPSVRLPPLWLVHLGEALPAAYPDWTADRLQRTGGGIARTIDELALSWSDPSLVHGWRWSVEQVGEALGPVDPAAHPDPFRPLAARQLIRHLDRQAQIHNINHLDTLHQVAVGAEIVTPYSSMIVLVNEAQRQELLEAEGKHDRFEREILGDTPVVTAVPEPGTWLLLGLGGAGWMLVKRRRRHLE